MTQPELPRRSPPPHIPLDAFAELASMSLTETSLEVALQKVVRACQQSLPGAADVSITMLADGRPATLASFGQLAIDLDEAQYARGHGPCLDASRGGGIVRIGDLRTESRWPSYVSVAIAHGVLSSLSVPLPEHAAVTGAINVYAEAAHAFDDASCDIAVTLASYTAVALADARVFDSAKREAEALRRAMESRAVIEQAKGILMSERRCTAAAAFEVLVQLSQDTNVKLRDVAAAVVERTTSRT
ncbi:MAG: hypothetical protein JWL64_1454 [Frankiales bacterium]|nr:hypothetical protein [Frankiales bacterium]